MSFLVPGRHLIRTSSLPPYGVASQKFSQTISNLAFTRQRFKNVNIYDSESLRAASSSMSFSII
ncbi:hypothetical protein CIK43_17185 [Citrobacter sp. TSA-1]|nr:hypothetical protein CIK43_17185 [Citrobacter sp. TSA-1]